MPVTPPVPGVSRWCRSCSWSQLLPDSVPRRGGGARAGAHVGKVFCWCLLLPQAVPGALLFGAGRYGPVGVRLCLLWLEPCSPRPRRMMAV